MVWMHLMSWKSSNLTTWYIVCHLLLKSNKLPRIVYWQRDIHTLNIEVLYCTSLFMIWLLSFLVDCFNGLLLQFNCLSSNSMQYKVDEIECLSYKKVYFVRMFFIEVFIALSFHLWNVFYSCYLHESVCIVSTPKTSNFLQLRSRSSMSAYDTYQWRKSTLLSKHSLSVFTLSFDVY